MTPQQYKTSPKHRRRFEDLVAWGANPEPLASSEIEKFLKIVYDGLMTERRGKPAHREAYIAWSIHEIRKMLQNFNACLTDQAGD